MVERCAQWVDYSPRNQVLFASYGVVGPVAGTGDVGAGAVDRGGPAVRAAGRGARSADPGAGDRRGHDAVAAVPAAGPFRVDRRRAPLGPGVRRRAAGPPPAPATRWSPVAVPAMRPGEWNEVVRRAAGRMLGQTPRKVVDPDQHLTLMAAKAPLPAGRPPLGDPALLGPGGVVGDRPGSGCRPGRCRPSTRRRCHRGSGGRPCVDVRASTDRVTGGGVARPRVDLRRARCPGSTPATTGRSPRPAATTCPRPTSAVCRSGCGWSPAPTAGASGWPVGSPAPPAGPPICGSTTAPTWPSTRPGRGRCGGSRRPAVAPTTASSPTGPPTVRRRQGRRARQRCASGTPTPPGPSTPHVSAPVAPQHGWVPLPGGRDDRTEGRVFDERVSAMIAPGPGGRWETWVEHRRQDDPRSARSPPPTTPERSPRRWATGR